MCYACSLIRADRRRFKGKGRICSESRTTIQTRESAFLCYDTALQDDRKPTFRHILISQSSMVKISKNMYISTSENRGEYIVAKRLNEIIWRRSRRGYSATPQWKTEWRQQTSENNPDYDSIREVLALYMFRTQDYYCISNFNRCRHFHRKGFLYKTLSMKVINNLFSCWLYTVVAN